jgi:hypothetical protein
MGERALGEVLLPDLLVGWSKTKQNCEVVPWRWCGTVVVASATGTENRGFQSRKGERLRGLYVYIYLYFYVPMYVVCPYVGNWTRLPDFPRYNKPKRGKIYQMATKYNKWPQNIPNGHTFSIPKPSKIYPNCEFCYENIPSANPVIERKRLLFVIYKYFCGQNIITCNQCH